MDALLADARAASRRPAQRRGDAMDPDKHGATSTPMRRSVSEAGEGVISTAIAVLIMAFIGAAMWIAFNTVFTDASDTVEEKVGEIGNS